MDYDTIIATISEIVTNDKIYKKGLVLEYTLDVQTHVKLNEHFFFKTKENKGDFEDTDQFEIEMEGVVIRFIKNE